MTRRRRGGTTLINANGGSRAWTKATAQFTAGKVCWLRFPKCTIRATTIDHYYPRKYRPDLADEPSLWKPACLYCNRARRHTPPHLIPALRAKLEAEAGKRPSKTALRFFG